MSLFYKMFSGKMSIGGGGGSAPLDETLSVNRLKKNFLIVVVHDTDQVIPPPSPQMTLMQCPESQSSLPFEIVSQLPPNLQRYVHVSPASIQVYLFLMYEHRSSMY